MAARPKASRRQFPRALRVHGGFGGVLSPAVAAASRGAYDGPVLQPPETGDTWTGLSEEPLPLETASSWAVLPTCGAVVTFSGTARDHSKGREDVSTLAYEAYVEQVVPRLDAIAAGDEAPFFDFSRMPADWSVPDAVPKAGFIG